MEGKHTPGPWKLNVDEDTGMNDSGCILDSVGHVIVTDIYGTFKNGRTTGEAEANARLIAAAPDLLATLIQAIEESGFNLCGPTDWRVTEHGEPKWVCKARATIAQATS